MSRRFFVAFSGALAVMGLVAGPASAHVTIQPGSAAKGGFATEFFQVPNERSDAQTTELSVTFPTDHPLAFVSTAPVAGWTVKVEMTKLATPIKSDDGDVTEAVSKITWSGGSIQPGQFERFPVSMGPLPDATSLEFKAVQTYSNGEVVRWVETATPGAKEPANPAPLLKLTAAAETKASTATAPAASVVPKNFATTDDVDSAKTIGIVGIALGALGLLAAIGALLRKRTIA